MSPASEVAKNVFSLARVLADTLGIGYLVAALETAQTKQELRDGKLEPDLSALTVIRSVDLISQLWQQYVSIALVPLANSSVTVRREMMIFNNQTMSKVESAVNALEQKVLDGVISWLGAQLLKQKKADFKPKDDDISFARVNTEPCINCCEILDKVRDAAKENLSGENLDNFLTEVGVTFHSMLLEHLKKFPVNATGGLMLAKDLKSYQDTIASFGMPVLDERFEFIRQLGNVFLVRPEVLKSYITEDTLGKIDSRLLRPYLAQRSDWGQFGYDSVAPGQPATESTDFGSANEGEVKKLRERLGMGKLSNMMKELETLKTYAANASVGIGGSGSGGGNGVVSGFSFSNMYG